MTNSTDESQSLKAEKLRRYYRDDPYLYAKDVLHIDWWSKQIEIAEALIEHKRVFVKASHSIGKSFLAASLVHWFFDCFAPAIVLTTAPTKDQVVDVLWKEVRRQCPPQSKRFLQPKAPRMELSESHYAVGYTAASGDAFQGRHEKNVLIIFDEAVGIPYEYWEAAEGMMTNRESCYWLCICNPTDTSSQAYIASEQSGNFHTISVCALDHPNIAAELAGEPIPFPSAVSLGWVRDRIKEWCDPISKEDFRAGDFEFPPGSGKHYRPGGLFEARVMGRWPTGTGNGVWSDGMWQQCLVPTEVSPADKTQIGCDVARFGDDYTEIMVRRGICVVHHERHNGWSLAQTCGRIKELCRRFARPSDDPQQILCNIDDGGVGGGVVDFADGYNFVGVNSATVAMDEEGYPNKRSELWFNTASRALECRVDLSRLDGDSLKVVRQQVMAPTWKMDAQGRRVVEPKADTKKRLGGSPDSADALNLVFYSSTTSLTEAAAISSTQRPSAFEEMSRY